MNSNGGMRYEAVKLAEQRLAEQGFALKTIHPYSGQGKQSHIFLLSGIQGDNREVKYVIKVFSKSYKHNSSKSVVKEYEALESFYEAIKACDGIACPRPIALFDVQWSYVMTFLPGCSLDQCMMKAQAAPVELVPKVIKGLEVYYGRLNDIYGDFQPKNILLQDTSIGFIDPTIANPAYYAVLQRGFSLAGTDMGYWLYTIASQAIKLSLQNRSLYLWRWLWCQRMLELAADRFSSGNRDRFYDEALEVASLHLGRLAKKGVKGYFLSRLAGWELQRNMRGVHQRILQ